MSTYVEISGRRTGKTSRLLQSFNFYNGKKFIVTPFAHSHLYNLVDSEHIVTSNYLRNEPIGILRYDRLENSKLFWDEFDLHEKDMSKYVKRGDYFVTTPKYTRSDWMFRDWVLGNRKDIMIKLINMVGGNYDKYVWKEHPKIDSIYEDSFNTKVHY